ncbi:MAG TPA: aspartate/glutamate racemase family protein [Solirubrobacteraceae bacterium]|nr:aspartate/glutamate racemase family protein [Solirubrobacteraceae bacterium]
MTRARLGLINPNTDAGDTAEMATIAEAALGPEVQLVALTARRGPRSIESAADDAIAAAEVVRLVAEHPELDCIVIGCFGDPGVQAARELTQAPVVGIGEAAYRAALMVARRFAVITTLARGVPDLEDGMERLGVRGSCVGVLPLDIPVARQGGEFPQSREAIIATGTEAVRSLGAEALVLACGAMTASEAIVSEQVGVPATSGVAVGALFAHALWRAGLRTSKVGSFAAPEAIEYAGMAALHPGAA